MRLAPERLTAIGASVAIPSYDRQSQESGIVHFGLGAFARAHLADYTDKAMSSGDRNWMITGVSMRSPTVAERVNPQGGLFSLTERGEKGETRIVGSLREVLVAEKDDQAIISAIASPHCHIVSFTVTEKGYCCKTDGSLDLILAKNGFYPLLASGLRRRKKEALCGISLLSCDNLPDNGAVLHACVTKWLNIHDPETARWFADNCTAPSTMVDRIVPAPDDNCRNVAKSVLGVIDEAAVATEPFSQWVIEDDFAGPRPEWETFGVQFSSDIEPFETAKLRMLNGAHSLLAYGGLAFGHVYVHQAIADPRLRAQVEQLMRAEAAPTIPAAKGQDLDAYADKLITRFENPAVQHRLAQIAMDGSQKLPQRWLVTLANSKNSCPAILAGIAAWLLHIDSDSELDDPLASGLLRILRENQSPSDRIRAIFGEGGLLLSPWKPTPEDIRLIATAWEELISKGEGQAC